MPHIEKLHNFNVTVADHGENQYSSKLVGLEGVPTQAVVHVAAQLIALVTQQEKRPLSDIAIMTTNVAKDLLKAEAAKAET